MKNSFRQIWWIGIELPADKISIYIRDLIPVYLLVVER